MRIGVNLLPFRERLAGAGRYAQNILRELGRADSTHHLILWVTPGARKHFEFAAKRVTYVNVPLTSANIAARVAWEQVILPFQLRHQRIDVLFTPSVAIPVLWRGHKVTVIHDMIAEHSEITKYPLWRRAYVRRMSRYAARASDIVLTVSEHSRREIAHYARVPVDKIQLAPDAVDNKLHPVLNAQERAAARLKYQLPEQFILYLGTLEPGKNLVRLVQAFRQMKHAYPELPHALVLAGARGWGTSELEREIVHDAHGDVRLIGFVDEDDLAAVYSLADLLVSPSLYEGFGLPPLEAMACGTPVVVSNLSALPEVVGEAGLLVNPYDTGALAQTMARGLSDDALRATMRAAGCARAKMFRWEASARVIQEAFERLAWKD